MELTKHIQMTWSEGWANVAWSANDPSCNTVEVITETDKAVRLATNGRSAWFPKSAFELDKHNTCFQVRNWFRAKMTMQQMKAIGYAC